MAKCTTGPKTKSAARVSGTRTAAKPTKKPTKSKVGDKTPRSASPQAEPGDWRVATLARMRALIVEAVPAMIEERKWKKPSNGMVGIPVWSRDGIVCTGETYKNVVKLTFAKGASLADPAKLFNASLEGNTRRAIDIGAGEQIDAKAFKALVKAAVALNGSNAKPTQPRKGKAQPRAKASQPVKLLSGGNPQIAKGYGDAPVQAYIAAMPGWKSAMGRRLDALISRAVPRVQKAVKWNSPLYGVEGQGWFLGVHVFTRYVKVAFFHGASLRPLPPGASKDKNTRYLDIHEDDQVDEVQFVAWVKQAAALPGWKG